MFRAFLFVPLLVSGQDSPADYVSTGLNSDKFNVLCVEDKCGHAIRNCAQAQGEGGQMCQQRLSCVQKETFATCFDSVKWSELDTSEVQIFDCARDNSCMDFNAPGLSLLEMESHTRLMTKDAEKNRIERQHLLHAKVALARTLQTEIAAASIQQAHHAFVKDLTSSLLENRKQIKSVIEDKNMDAKGKLDAMNILEKDALMIKDSIEEHLKTLAQQMGVKSSSFAEVRPSSMSLEEGTAKETSGMTAQATQLMDNTLHKWEQNIKMPTFGDKATEDESKQILEQAELKKTFEDQFREGFRESVAQNAHQLRSQQ